MSKNNENEISVDFIISEKGMLRVRVNHLEYEIPTPIVEKLLEGYSDYAKQMRVEAEARQDIIKVIANICSDDSLSGDTVVDMVRLIAWNEAKNEIR